MKKLLFLFLLSSFYTYVFSQDLVPMRGKIKGGYDFWLYEPKGWEADSIQKPLVVFLHGASLCGRNLDRVRRYGTLDALDRGRMIDAFVLAPQNPGGAWKPSMIMDAVNWVSENYQVDTNRIYVLGMSLGGYGTIDFAATYPDKIAAAMAICGGGTVKNLEDGMNSMLNMMYSLIALLIVVSIVLAIVIIYNLGIMSFSEKEYQFATLKVLGYKYKQIKKIFIKQNIWIGVFAILIALPLGNYMTDYIFKNAIGDTYDFEAMIKPVTFIMSSIGTFVVVYIVNQFLAKKIKKIDMVSSLKGNE
jgi:hypothetical protein